MPNPIDDPELYDFIVLAGQKSPGLVDVSGASAPREWDIRKAYGLSGTTVVYTGDGLAKFTVRLFFWESEHFKEWETFKELVKKPRKGTKPKALDISHPYLEELEIHSVVVEDVTQFTQPEDGLFVKDVKFLQYVADKNPTLGKPQSSMSSPYEGAGAQGAFDSTIQALTQQVKELAQ